MIDPFGAFKPDHASDTVTISSAEAPPLPEEIAGLITRNREWAVILPDLPNEGVAQLLNNNADALRALALENERLRLAVTNKNEACAELAQENERLQLAWHDAECGRDKWMTDAALSDRRIRELEAERDNFREDAERAIGHAAKFAQAANAMKNERDAIRAKTFQRCEELAGDRAETFHTECRRMAARDIRDSIRALAQTDEATDVAEPAPDLPSTAPPSECP